MLFVEPVGDEGLPLIVLHGGPGLDHTHLRPWLDPLGEDFRVLYVDERGQGQSERVDPATLSLEVFARDVDLLADALGLDRFALLGHSFGAISRPGTQSTSARRPATSSPAAATRARS
jgi:pimeloyl-ACP methyl ester carboxylesterase